MVFRRRIKKKAIDIISSYFTEIFNNSSSSDVKVNTILDSVWLRLSSNFHNFLDAAFIVEEVKVALFQISPSKAPGKDGFPINFYQKFWGVIGDDVTKICLECLNEGQSMT